jgi:uncharacterized membrane-anchored protein YhcB (DUF1043 family)
MPSVVVIGMLFYQKNNPKVYSNKKVHKQLEGELLTLDEARERSLQRINTLSNES